jgi:2-polyprenyl-3-methyl-5-hydroxy-6-metoxy-1,4-benzoquinol methylase
MSQPSLQDKIEILSTDLLDQNRSLVIELRRLAGALGLEFGWHYLLDLTWIISQLGQLKRRNILDAGAGVGVLQWYLADKGARVLSVDRTSRAALPLRFRRHYQVSGMRREPEPDLLPVYTVLRQHPRQLLGVLNDLVKSPIKHRSQGSLVVYNQDLKSLVAVADNSLDYVVGVSALEHNPPDELPAVVAELMRVLRPGGAMLVTLGAARDQDWFHQPSSGWCYTESSLRKMFDLPDQATSNYAHHDELFAALQNCTELRYNLAHFYAKSGDNGMPWGIWDPQYLPVGVCKVKAIPPDVQETLP